MATTSATTGADPATVDRFVQAAEAAGSIVHRVPTVEVIGDLVRSLAGPSTILVTTEVLADVALCHALGAVETTADATVAADRPVAVERGTLAVAETGSVLVREPDRESRLASMLATTLVQVVGTDDVVASLDEVATWLSTNAADGYAALITGPSRTADIERVLTVGVQGPAELHVVLIAGATA